jgi:hypothetical protein
MINTTLVNAVPVEVTYLDGRRETISLSKLTNRQIYTFIELLNGNKTPALVALCAGRPEDWIDELTEEAFGLLVAKSYELNFQKALRLIIRDPAIGSMSLPMLRRLEALEQESRSRGPITNTPSPAPAPSGSAAETGSGSSISPPTG